MNNEKIDKTVAPLEDLLTKTLKFFVSQRYFHKLTNIIQHVQKIFKRDYALRETTEVHQEIIQKNNSERHRC